jgi:hypothetical protein
MASLRTESGTKQTPRQKADKRRHRIRIAVSLAVVAFFILGMFITLFL